VSAAGFSPAMMTAVFGFEDLGAESKVKSEGDRGGSGCEEKTVNML